MQFSVLQSELLNEMTRLSGVTEAKSTIPILSTILFETNGSGLKLSATNLDISLQSRCAIGLLSAPGSACLPARKLFEIVKSLPKGVEMEFDVGDQCSIKAQRSRFKLPAMKKEDFPEIKESPSSWMQLPAGLWQVMVDRVLFAITNEESRYALNGALFKLASRTLKLVSTDGHRLAYTESPVEFDADIEVLIPKKALIESAKLADGANFIDFTISDSILFWRVNDRILSSRTLGGQFPNYEMVLPNGNNQVVVADRESLLAGIRRVALMSDERSHAIKLTFNGDQIELTAQASESGEATDGVSAEYEGEEIVTGFNAQYLVDALTAIQTAQVKVMLKNGSSQVEIGPVGDAKDVYRSVIMPMRI